MPPHRRALRRSRVIQHGAASPTLLNALATETGQNIRTISRALDGVPPDGKLGKHAAWYLRTALDALARREVVGSATAVDAVCDRIEQLAGELEADLEATRIEADIERRRSAIARFGWKVGELLRLMESAAGGTRPTEKRLLHIVRDHAVGDIINEILELGNWKLSFNESESAAC
jgi:hypothetical protein